MKQKVLLAWSGGKDAALALHQLESSARYEVAALLTTVTEE
ncbi:MAG TPA: ATP-binding protein, partial [Chloroflexi bacterium]|nr:ATP-binding protein [Chloroflexota bacterium]